MKFPYTIMYAVVVLARTAIALSIPDRRAFLSKSVPAALASITAAPFAAAADEIVDFDPRAPPQADLYQGFMTTASGIKYKVIKKGRGATPRNGDTVKVAYTGWLYGFPYSPYSKMVYTTSYLGPFIWKLGKGIPGWDEYQIFGAMKWGEKRRVVIPPRKGVKGGELVFEVELLVPPP
jgi:FKBP-type peptidyl-prolyl cis-trans isomerase